MKNQTNRYMSVLDVAKILNVHFRTVYSLIYTGQLGHIRVGRVFRISQDQLDEYIAQKTKGTWN
jgi:excisionase family DNA binding protein